MEETKKITKEELTSIYDVQNALSKVVNQIGMLETEKTWIITPGCRIKPRSRKN